MNADLANRYWLARLGINRQRWWETFSPPTTSMPNRLTYSKEIVDKLISYANINMEQGFCND